MNISMGEELMKNNTNKQCYNMQLDFTLPLSLKSLNELLELCILMN